MPEAKTNNIYTALLQSQKDMGPVRKDGRGNYGKYATLDGVIDTIADTLNQNGIVYMQPLVMIEGEQHIKTILVHAESGGSVDSYYKVVCKDMVDPQKIGGALTYGRRYSLLALLGLAPEDDDAQSASTPGSYTKPASVSPTEFEDEEKVPCEVPGCKSGVRLSKLEVNHRYHDGHTICYLHSTNGDWKAAIAQKEEEARFDVLPDEEGR
jgi:hypothetical protein